MVQQRCNMRKFRRNRVFTLPCILVLVLMLETCSAEEKAPAQSSLAANKTTAGAHDSAVQNTNSRFLAALVPQLQQFRPAYISPFSPPQFTQQLVPLIGASVKQKLREIVEDFDDGVEFLKNAFTIKEQFAKNIVSNHLQKYKTLQASPLFAGYKHFHPHAAMQVMPPQPTMHTTIRIYTKKPYYRYSTDGKILAECQHQFGNCSTIEQIPEAHSFVAEMGIESYKKFEKDVLRGIEAQEEKKVEATLSPLAAISSGTKGFVKPPKKHISDWKPVVKEYKKPEPPKKEYPKDQSYVRSTLNTNIISSSEDSLENLHLIGNYPKKFPKVYKKPKATPDPEFSEVTYHGSHADGPGHAANYNSTIYFDSTTQQEVKVEAPQSEMTESASAPAGATVRKLKPKKGKSRSSQLFQESRPTKVVADKPKYNPERPTYNPERPKPKEAPRPKIQRSTNRQEASESVVSDYTAPRPKTAAPAATKRPFVDRVKATGNRGSIKFDSSKATY